MVLVLSLGIITGLSINVSAQEYNIPSWIKNNAKWWSQGQIDDSEFVKGMQYLMQQGIMKIPQTSSSSSSSNGIPSWIKNNAGWWASGTISDDDFVKGMQYLVQSNIIQVSVTQQQPNQGNISCKGTAGCFFGPVTHVIDGDTVVVNDVHIRFALAAAPELSQKGGVEAKEFVESICQVGSKALVDEDDGQRGGSYGRTIGELYCGDTLVNSALLEKGLGTIDKRFCGTSEFASEGWAKKYGC